MENILMSTVSLLEQAGVIVPTNLPNNKISTVFEATGLNWEVTQHPVQSDFGVISNAVANYRSDTQTFLGFVNPKTYKVVQNIDAFNFIDELDDFTFEKVGSFNNGKKVFVVGKSNEKIDIDGSGDMIDFYFTFLHGHDGKSGIRFIICPIRMFCMNQLNLMLDSASFKYNITHTGDIQWKLDEIHKAINKSKKYVTSLSTTIDELIKSKPTQKIDNFVNLLIPDKEDESQIISNRKEIARNTIIQIYNDKPDLQNYKNTKFGYLSAVSDYVSHLQPLRTESENTVTNTFIKNLEGNRLIESARYLLAA